MKNKDAWLDFTQGYWQKEVPTRPGKYPVAARNGERAHDRILVLSGGKIIDACCHTEELISNWGGWWWSKPIPELPVPAEWKKGE